MWYVKTEMIGALNFFLEAGYVMRELEIFKPGESQVKKQTTTKKNELVQIRKTKEASMACFFWNEIEKVKYS